MLFNNEDEFFKHVEYLKTLTISEDSIFKIKNFLKFSPNKFARKIGIDEEEFQKEFNQIKKPLHLKLLYYKKVISLRDYRPELGIFEKFINLGRKWDSDWVKVQLRKSMCVCIKSFKRHGDPTFYETIYYSYCQYEYEYILFDSNDKSIELNSDEFNHYFIDYRDWAIGKILS
jgi:hypothetical protein